MNRSLHMTKMIATCVGAGFLWGGGVVLIAGRSLGGGAMVGASVFLMRKFSKQCKEWYSTPWT